MDKPKFGHGQSGCCGVGDTDSVKDEKCTLNKELYVSKSPGARNSTHYKTAQNIEED